MVKPIKTNPIVRSGEGTLVSATPNTIVGTDGQSSVTMNIDLASAPVPDRRYVADFSGLICKGDIIKLIFGQEKIGSGSIRSLVVIAMHMQDVRFMMQNINGGNAPENLPGLVEVAKSANITASELYEISDEPEQTIALSANFALIAISGHAACIDFYSSSAFAIADLPKTQKLAVEPVVRIDLPTSYLLSINNKYDELFPIFITGEQL